MTGRRCRSPTTLSSSAAKATNLRIVTSVPALALSRCDDETTTVDGTESLTLCRQIQANANRSWLVRRNRVHFGLAREFRVAARFMASTIDSADRHAHGWAMILVAHGWDGTWAALVGGLVSGVTVVLGVVLAQWLADTRRREQEVRAAADALLVEIGNARDAAVRSRSKARSGSYDLWPLRHRLYLSHSLRGRPVIEAVQNFYDAVWELREWLRGGPVNPGERKPRPPDEDVFVEFARAVDVWGDKLIEALKHPSVFVDDELRRGPERPTLD